MEDNKNRHQLGWSDIIAVGLFIASVYWWHEGDMDLAIYLVLLAILYDPKY